MRVFTEREWNELWYFGIIPTVVIITYFLGRLTLGIFFAAGTALYDLLKYLRFKLDLAKIERDKRLMLEVMREMNRGQKK